jgi:CelD/BcsL family acetyltransferase involved in cellulose biosynthesis
MAIETELIETVEGLDRVSREWDDLAVALGRPYCAPGWIVPWARHVAPAAGSLLRVVVARDADGMAGVAPFHAQRWRGVWRYDLLATDMSSRVEPLVRADVADAATGALLGTLAAVDPKPGIVRLAGVPVESRWGERLRAAWPGGRPYIRSVSCPAAPVITLAAEDLDGWLSGRSANFRGQMRRYRRRLADAGGAHRTTERLDAIDAEIGEFERLHRGRRESRGGTDAFPPGARAMLADVARELLPEGRMVLNWIELEGRGIASHLFLGAGRELSYWNGGFDDDHAELRPSYVGLVDGVAAAIDGGYERLDLGPGDQSYKYRFADGEDQLEVVVLIPRGRLLARAAYAPVPARAALAARLTTEQKEWIRSRLPGGRDAWTRVA